MGLMTSNYEVSGLGITLSEAYAKVGKIEIDRVGNAKAFLEIQQTREDVETLQSLETHEVNFVADKTQPIYEQAYIAAKSSMFSNWIDDIPEKTEGEETV